MDLGISSTNHRFYTFRLSAQANKAFFYVMQRYPHGAAKHNLVHVSNCEQTLWNSE
jgi:hypothetical protein